MKRVIFGGIMLLSGVLGTAMLMVGAMAHEWTLDNRYSYSWNLTCYGLMPALYIFITIGAAGLLIGIWGLLGKETR